jgi:glycosyltransferase involved in cell wall biosynthesis
MDLKKIDKIKILYIGPIPPEVGGQSYGGIATHLWELATQARRKAYDVYILANATSFTQDGIKVIGLPPKNKLLKAFYGVKFWLTLDKTKINFLNFIGFKEKLGMLYRAYCLKSIKPDLIHVHSLHNSDNLVLKILQPSIPVVITDHGAFWGIKEEKDLVRVGTALSVASSVICVSQYVKKRLEQLNLKYRKKLSVIHNPINVNRLPLLNREGLRRYKWGKKKIVFFSGVTEPIRRKRLDLLLRTLAADNYLRDNCKLVILTGGEGVRYAKEFISRNEIDGIVLSRIQWDEIVEYYTVSDVFVMPSISEPFGIVYVEALLAGTPVVGFHETVKELENSLDIYIGEKFDASREEEKKLAQKIIKVLNTDFDRKLLRRKAIENLSWDVKFNEFDSIYKEILKYARKLKS